MSLIHSTQIWKCPCGSWYRAVSEIDKSKQDCFLKWKALFAEDGKLAKPGTKQ
jgi:hypothetical protein